MRVFRRSALLVAALVAMLLLAVGMTAMAADQKVSLSDVQISAVMPSTATTFITMPNATLTTATVVNEATSMPPNEGTMCTRSYDRAAGGIYAGYSDRYFNYHFGPITMTMASAAISMSRGVEQPAMDNNTINMMASAADATYIYDSAQLSTDVNLPANAARYAVTPATVAILWWNSDDVALITKHTAITGMATSLGHTSRDAVALFQGYSDATATTTAIHNYAGTQLGEIRGLRA